MYKKTHTILLLYEEIKTFFILIYLDEKKMLDFIAAICYSIDRSLKYECYHIYINTNLSNI
jgi:hypothetical protein